MNMKVEIGQEWQHYKRNNKPFIVSKIGLDYAVGRYYGEDLDRAQILLKLNTNEIEFPQYWEFLGHPITCEDCNKFCKQRCNV